MVWLHYLYLYFPCLPHRSSMRRLRAHTVCSPLLTILSKSWCPVIVRRVDCTLSNMNPAEDEALAKKRRIETLFTAPLGSTQRTPEEMKEAFDMATQAHPFIDLSDHRAEITGDAVFCDGKGNVVGVLIRNGVPVHAVQSASNVLRTAASRTSLRANIFGGESPLSGIAGYYDYSGSPVDLKCRKTSFTCEVIKTWKDVFPLVEYVSQLYRSVAPVEWECQNNAIPDIVRVNESPFSTLTINQRFRTAKHTDAGDFDNGFGVLAVLEGDFEGLHLGLADFRVCFHMQPRDVLVFNTHHFHANTELERFGQQPDWNRLTCVFYYRSSLGEPACLQHYRRRLEVAKKLPKAQQAATLPTSIVEKNNGDNFNRPATVHPVVLSPFLVAASAVGVAPKTTKRMAWLHRLMLPPFAKTKDASKLCLSSLLVLALFGEESVQPIADGLPQRSEAETNPPNLQVTLGKGSPLGGFSEAAGAVDVAAKNHKLLNEAALKDALGGDTPLWRMWNEARTLWLALVKRDWDRMLEINPDRVDFSWKNKSDMNTAFFDLCEVARNVMLQLLQKEAPTKTEENAFWLCFAGHLYHSCETELNMAKDAMSMRKLNVKLKDFNFGGTRYFVDMPKEEQERRLLRRKRIEEARRMGNHVAQEVDTNWLENDDFDYQSEACDVPYKRNGWQTPEENARALGVGVASRHAAMLNESMEDGNAAPLRIVVVVPSPTAPGTPTPVTQHDVFEGLKLREYERLAKNKAALRSVDGGAVAAIAIDANGMWSPTAQLSVQFVDVETFCGAQPGHGDADVIVLRHCLAFMGDEAADDLLRRAHTVAPTMVVESVVSCRSEFLLQADVLDAFNGVVRRAISDMLAPWLPALPQPRCLAVPSLPPTNLRTKAELCRRVGGVADAPVVKGIFHFPRSPRNSSVWVL